MLLTCSVWPSHCEQTIVSSFSQDPCPATTFLSFFTSILFLFLHTQHNPEKFQVATPQGLFPAVFPKVLTLVLTRSIPKVPTLALTRSTSTSSPLSSRLYLPHAMMITYVLTLSNSELHALVCSLLLASNTHRQLITLRTEDTTP